jgi:hypothetical protein
MISDSLSSSSTSILTSASSSSTDSILEFYRSGSLEKNLLRRVSGSVEKISLATNGYLQMSIILYVLVPSVVLIGGRHHCDVFQKLLDSPPVKAEVSIRDYKSNSFLFMFLKSSTIFSSSRSMSTVHSSP